MKFVVYISEAKLYNVRGNFAHVKYSQALEINQIIELYHRNYKIF